MRAALEAGRSPNDLDLAVMAAGAWVQVVDDGQVAAASPGLDTLPPLFTVTPGGNVVQVDPSEAVGLPPGSLTLTRERVGRYDILAASPLDTVRRSVDAVHGGLLVSLPAPRRRGGAARVVPHRSGPAPGGAHPDRRWRPSRAPRWTAASPSPASGDEVARLATTMNAMLDRLEDASTRQQRFVADASHELRSPVAAIRTELEVAQRTAGPEEWPVVAERLLAEEARLEAVIADLLLLASLDEGAASEHVVVDVAELAVEEARRRAPERAAVVHRGGRRQQAALVHGSRTQLRRAVVNLLDNAGRHARSPPCGSPCTSATGGSACSSTTTGPASPRPTASGCSSASPASTSTAPAAPPSGGAGLGLSLVRRIAVLHDGTAVGRHRSPRWGPTRGRPPRPPPDLIHLRSAACTETGTSTRSTRAARSTSPPSTRRRQRGPGDKDETKAALEPLVDRLADFQARLWAEADRRVLVVLQGIDTSGKGGTIEHVFGAVHPAGPARRVLQGPVERPSWRATTSGGCTPTCPPLASWACSTAATTRTCWPPVWRATCPRSAGGAATTTSTGSSRCSPTRAPRSSRCSSTSPKDEQRERLQARLDDPTKRWKFRLDDLGTRAHWDDYRAAFEEMIERTGTEHAAWHVVPADRKWYRNWAVATILVGVLEHLDPAVPRTAGRSVRRRHPLTARWER